MDVAWFVHFPGSAYAGEFYGKTEQEARQAARDWLGTKRLPKGTSVWRKSPGHDQALASDPVQQELFRTR